MASQSPAVLAFYTLNATRFKNLKCTYTRGNQNVPNVPINRGKSRLSDDDGAGGRIENASNDFVIPRAPLLTLDGSFTPAKGDTVAIVNAVTGKTETFELMTPPYSPSDHAGELFRLHTQLISVQ